MEIHALSKIYNKAIIEIFQKYDYNKKIYYYEKSICYNFININIIDIDNIIYLCFENNNHYNLL